MSPRNWLEWRFGSEERDPEAFQQKANVVFGYYQPGHTPVFENPLATGNEIPRATVVHEYAHGELTRTTQFGLFSEVLFQLRNTTRYGELWKLAAQHQWQVQEGCATYVGLSYVASAKPELLGKSIAQLPSLQKGNAPYLEVFDAVSKLIPISTAYSSSRLQALGDVALAIGRLSMDCDCLTQFADPSSTHFSSLNGYLSKQSPNSRFKYILDTLQDRNEINAIIDRVERDHLEEVENPVRTAMAELLTLLPAFEAVRTFIEGKEQHRKFREAWQPIVSQYGEGFDDGAGRIPGLGGGSAPATLSLEELRAYFISATVRKHGLWTVIAFREDSTIVVDVMPYELGSDGNPVSLKASSEAVRHHGFRTGRYSADEVIELFNEFPNLPHAITFPYGSWFEWQKRTKGLVAGRKSVQVSLAHELSEKSLFVTLAFENLHRRAQYFGERLDDDHAVVYFVDPDTPRRYAIQYVAGELGYSLLDVLLQKYGLKHLPAADQKIAHLELLRLMIAPAFMVHRDGGSLKRLYRP